MKLLDEVIQHTVVVEFEPRPFDGGYSKGPKMAYAIKLSWGWDGEWKCSRGTIYFKRVKKDGTLYQEPQDSIIWREDRAAFEDLFTATEPHYVPVPASVDARSERDG